ncbi:hypothetical protein vseg_015142 [Gypsophila vaccaria]
MKGNLCSQPTAIQEAFIEYYQHLLGSSKETTKIHRRIIDQGPRCSEESGNRLLMPITRKEIKEALFSIPDNKSPGPDGYTSKFFKDAWATIGEDMIEAVKDFFVHKKLLTQENATNLTLIPKCDAPKIVMHFRPIACCNVVYKVISKLLCTRLASVLPHIIDKNQGAYIQGRNIQENILIFQDLVRLYERPHSSPRCLLKIDLQKAYDSVEWNFVAQMLDHLQFPLDFKTMIMECITSPSYSLSLNGEMFGFFKGKR